MNDREIYLVSSGDCEDNKFFAFTNEDKAREKKKEIGEGASLTKHYIDDVPLNEVYIVSLQDYFINPGECHETIYETPVRPKEIIQYYLRDLAEEGVHFNSEGKVADISRDIACGKMALTSEGDGSFISVNVEAFKSFNVFVKKIPLIS